MRCHPARIDAVLTSLVPGMAYFVNEYVIRRAIPIPKLLYAFGVCLVSFRTLATDSATRNLSPVPTATMQNAQDPAVFPRGGHVPRVSRVPSVRTGS